MKRSGIFCLVALLWPLAAGARLGENGKQIAARFGPPNPCGMTMVLTNDTCYYVANEFTILVAYSNGLSVAETYTSTNDVLSEEVAKAFLDQQAGTSTWEHTASVPLVDENYRLANGEAIARHEYQSPTILIVRPAFWKAWCALVEHKTAARFKGF